MTRVRSTFSLSARGFVEITLRIDSDIIFRRQICFCDPRIDVPDEIFSVMMSKRLARIEGIDQLDLIRPWGLCHSMLAQVPKIRIHYENL
jgi:hypothetical protein